MTFEQAFIALIGFSCAVLGWLARELYSAVKKLQSDLSSLEVRISIDYVRYDRLHEALAPLVRSLDEVKSALIRMQDRQHSGHE
jgi:hypothetical protein